MQVSLQAARTILSHGCCPTASLSVEWPGDVANSMPSKNGPCEFPRSPLVPFLSPVLPEPGIHVSGVPGTPKDAFAALIFFLTVSRKVGVRFLSSK